VLREELQARAFVSPVADNVVQRQVAECQLARMPQFAVFTACRIMIIMIIIITE